MKTLSFDQLSVVAGGEPHGMNGTGRQLDGYDIKDSYFRNTTQIPKPEQHEIVVTYGDGSWDTIKNDGSMRRVRP